MIKWIFSWAHADCFPSAAAQCGHAHLIIFIHTHTHTHFCVDSRRGCCCWGCSRTRWPEMTWCPPGLPPLPSGWARRRSAPCAGLLRLWTGSFRPWRTAPDPRRLITGASLSLCSFVSSNKKSPSGIPVMVRWKRLPFGWGRLRVTWRGGRRASTLPVCFQGSNRSVSGVRDQPRLQNKTGSENANNCSAKGSECPEHASMSWGKNKKKRNINHELKSHHKFLFSQHTPKANTVQLKTTLDANNIYKKWEQNISSAIRRKSFGVLLEETKKKIGKQNQNTVWRWKRMDVEGKAVWTDNKLRCDHASKSIFGGGRNEKKKSKSHKTIKESERDGEKRRRASTSHCSSTASKSVMYPVCVLVM